MAKDIVKEDLPKVSDLCVKIIGSDYKDIERMGGLTNHTYHVTMADGAEYVVRIPGEGTEDVIVRSDEKKSTELACKVGVDARLLYFGDEGSKVTDYIKGAVTQSAESLKADKRIRQVAEIFKKLHSCGEDTGVPFEVFDMAEIYKKAIADKNVAMFADWDSVEKQVMEIKAEVDKNNDIKKVPCHNDSLCENWVADSDDRLYLIDWEYSGMNDFMWDLADVSIEAVYNDDLDNKLLRAYFGRDVEKTEKKHFLASKIYVDYLWTLWAKMRVPYDGQDMEDWAVERYNRMKTFIEDYKKL